MKIEPEIPHNPDIEPVVEPTEPNRPTQIPEENPIIIPPHEPEPPTEIPILPNENP